LIHALRPIQHPLRPEVQNLLRLGDMTFPRLVDHSQEELFDEPMFARLIGVYAGLPVDDRRDLVQIVMALLDFMARRNDLNDLGRRVRLEKGVT